MTDSAQTAETTIEGRVTVLERVVFQTLEDRIRAVEAWGKKEDSRIAAWAKAAWGWLHTNWGVSVIAVAAAAAGAVLSGHVKLPF